MKRNGNRSELPNEAPATSQTDPIAMRRAKPQKPNIMKFLEEIGYEDIFDGGEVKDIKEMLNKNTANMTKNEVLIDSIHKFEAEDDEIKESVDEVQSQNGSNGEDHKDSQVSNYQLKQTSIKKTMGTTATYELRNHLDGVRDGAFLPNIDQAVTVSEDCTIKLWDIRNINQEDKQLTENTTFNFIDDGSDFAGTPQSFYSYYTLRGHTGIVTSVDVDKSLPENDDTVFYTAGIEGIVRVWRAPRSEDIDQFGQDSDLSSKL